MDKKQLFENIKAKKSFLCVGLDTDIKKIPQHLLKEEDPIFSFNKAIIDATAPYCIAYKPNLAFYESMGVKGWISFEKTIKYLNENYPNHFIIADAKRGDIGNTSAMYARTFFEEMNIDSVTVAPYMGEDSVSPFLTYPNKWVILLALTSNKGSHDFQLTADSNGERLFEKVLRQSQNWGNDEKGSWSSEGGTYWFDGLVHLAWQMDDPYLKDLAKKRLEPVLANMHANAVGTLWWMDRRDPKQMEEFFGPGAWQSRWVLGMRERALAAYYEATGDARAKRAIEWAYGNEEIARRAGWGATFAAGCIDVARVTGSGKVRACAEIAVAELKKNSQYAKPPAPWLPETLWTRRTAQNALKMPTRHGVFCAEQLLGVWRAWQFTGDTSLRDAVLAWYAFLDKNCHQPYGLTMMDEEWGWAGAKRGTETCDVAAETFTRINVLAGTGDGKWGDDVERVQFNAAPACVSRDFKRHVYFQLPNRAGLPGEAKELSCPYDSQCEYRESKQWPLCCVAALNKVLPNYIQAMWMKTEDGGVAATAYGRPKTAAWRRRRTAPARSRRNSRAGVRCSRKRRPIPSPRRWRSWWMRRRGRRSRC